MRRFQLGLLLVVCWIQSALVAAEFTLNNGEVIKGEPSSINADGMVIRREIGGFSDRIGWGHLTQGSLKLLLDHPEAKQHVEPFIDVPIEEKARKRAERKEIIVKDPPPMDRPVKGGFFAGLMTPAGFMVLGLFFFANLYAAFHIAKFKARPVAVVVGTSLILPVVGPILFLIMPGTDEPVAVAPEPTAGAGEVVSAEAKVPGMQSGLGLAAHQKPEKAAGGGGEAQVYKRTEVTFDRRFFETKFTGYFRVVPEKPDMVLVVKTAKAEYVARRISRISGSEVHMQLLRGNTEVGVSFGEIYEVSVRHKDAKA